jgi:osmotically-inducible protein OsmY
MMRNAVVHDNALTTMPGTGAGQVWRLLDAGQRTDGEVRRDVQRALMLDSLVPLNVDAQVADGIVTLTGAVNWPGECDDAMFLAACVPGVMGILSEIAVIPPPGRRGGEVEDDIVEALAGTAAADDGELCVQGGYDGTVVLSGVVRSWSDHDEAVGAAWSVPGVTAVDDRVIVDCWRDRQ